MLRILLATLLAVFAFHCVSAQQGEDYRVRLGRQRNLRGDEPGSENNTSTNATLTCKSAGYVCNSADCDHVYACMSTGGGQFKPFITRKCPDDQQCLNGNCSSAPNPQCNGILDVAFRCNSIGTFPDPFNCKHFHMCYPKADGTIGEALGKCSANYGYNAKTMFCDKKLLVNDTCGPEYPVPLCSDYGQTAALKEHPSLFYLCLPVEGNEKVLYPNLYACDNGGIYNNKLLTCS